MTDGAHVPVRPVGRRSPLLPVLLLGLGLGVVVGLGLGRGTLLVPAPTTSPDAAPSISAGTSVWVANAWVAPELLRAYYANRVTSGGVGPVVCTTDNGLVCQGVLAYSHQTPGSTQIPGPAELWRELGPVHLAHTGGAIDALLVDDVSPGVYARADILGPGEPWTDTAGGASVSVDGAAGAMDLGRLSVGQYVVLIRHVDLAPPSDGIVLVVFWEAIGIEVDS